MREQTENRLLQTCVLLGLGKGTDELEVLLSSVLLLCQGLVLTRSDLRISLP